MQKIKKLITTYPKWLVLALAAGIGCFTMALVFGELFLALTNKPVPPVRPQVICLTIDVSGSMAGAKLNEVKQAANNFISRRDLSIDTLALVTFSDNASVQVPFTQNASSIASSINSLSAKGGTNFEAAIQRSAGVLQTDSGDKNILLFTDGESTVGNPSNAKTIADNLRGQGIRIFAIATNDADERFLSSLTGDTSRVIRTQDGQFEQAFAKAEAMIYRRGLMDSGGAYTFREAMWRVCIWTAFLCFGIAIFVRMVQNILMQRNVIIRIVNVVAILVATAIVGFVAGGCGQILFGIFSFFGLPYIDRIIAWTLLGLISAYGLSLFIPNLNKDWAWKSGAIGGALGAGCFIYLTHTLGDIGGRLTGAFVLGCFIGLMVGIVEVLVRDAYLKITFPGNETTTLNLGEMRISLGSGRSDTVYVSGVTENAMTFYLDKGKLLCYKDGQSSNISIGDTVTLGNVTVEVCGTKSS